MSLEERDIIDNLRALIISCKGGVLLNDVQKDYLEAFGTEVPLQEVKCNSLKEFFLRNSSNFRLIGDKVEVVQISASRHIASLVDRQKSKSKNSRRNFRRQRRPKKSEAKLEPESVVNNPNSFSSYKKQKTEATQKITKENNEKQVYDGKESSGKFRAPMNHYQKITLRKPHDSRHQSPSNSYLGQEGALKTSPQENTFQNVNDLKSIRKTIKNDRISGNWSPIGEPKTPGFDGTTIFKDVEDLPNGKGAQSRLLRQKMKMMQELKTENRDIPNSSNSSPYFPTNPSNVFFDLDSIHPPFTLQLSFPGDPTKAIPKQSAQARFANIKSYVQSKINSNERDVNNLDHSSMLGKHASFNNNSNNNNHNNNNNYLLSLPLKQLNGEVSGEEPKKLESNSIVITKPLESDSETEHVKRLKELCISKSLPEPIYKILVREPKNEPKYYICKIHIEDKVQMSSYPGETLDPKSAIEIAARKVYNYLISDEKHQSNPIVNEKVLMTRVMEIVGTSCGIWSDKLPALYEDNFKEVISKDWLGVIKKIPWFEIQEFDGTRCIIRKKTDTELSHILNQPQNATSTTNSLVELVVPESDCWEIYITNINNSAEIWCRLIGDAYSDAYDDMMTKLELEPPERKAENPKIGEIYGIKGSAIWDRVKLVKLIDEEQGLVFYIDTGDKDMVDLTELYLLDDIYFAIAPQAIMLSLFELESFADDENLTTIITENLLCNTYIAEVINLSKTNVNTHQDRRAVRLWDTSTEVDVNVNQQLLNNIIKNITLPILPNKAQIKEVFVSWVTDKGDLYVQTNKKSVHDLECIILNKIKAREENRIGNTNNTIGANVLYLAKCTKYDCFSRAKVTDIQSSSTVNVLFIDYGYTEKMEIKNLINLEQSSILQAIPAQAVKVRLANVQNTGSAMADKLREMVLNQNVLMKVVESKRGSQYQVELFKRPKNGSILYSVNMKISNDPELKNTDGPTRKKSVVVGLEKVLPKSLPPPEIPETGQYFEVFVTLASSPDLFIVQPLSSLIQLKEMMTELQKICDSQNPVSLPADDFSIGELYAVKHPDGNWYRGCAQAVVGSHTYSVYMCDFGDCIMVTIEKLMPLPAKFKIFPYQAIRATLHGIPPEHKDWTPIDCITFHKLVVEKYFVSTVMGINRDAKNPNYISLELTLTDTSGDEDVYIHKVLMENKNEAFAFIKSLSNT